MIAVAVLDDQYLAVGPEQALEHDLAIERGHHLGAGPGGDDHALAFAEPSVGDLAEILPQSPPTPAGSRRPGCAGKAGRSAGGGCNRRAERGGGSRCHLRFAIAGARGCRPSPPSGPARRHALGLLLAPLPAPRRPRLCAARSSSVGAASSRSSRSLRLSPGRPAGPRASAAPGTLAPWRSPGSWPFSASSRRLWMSASSCFDRRPPWPGCRAAHSSAVPRSQTSRRGD